MTTSSKQLVSEFQDIVLSFYGEHQNFEQAACPSECNVGDLVFVFDSSSIPQSASVIVTCEEVAQIIKESSSAFIIVVKDVRLAQAKIKQRFDDYQVADAEWQAIHPSAVVHESTKLAAGCRVGPNAVVGAKCVLGENVVIRAGTIVEHGVTIGANSVINANANIGYCSKLGERVTVQAGAAIGTEGFGFAPDQENHYHRIPHTGYVLILSLIHI